MIEHLDGLAVRSASEIWNRELEFREYVVGPESLYEVCRATMGSALRLLACGRLEEPRVSELRALGRTASGNGTPLEVVLRGLRVDFLVLWSEMLLVARTTDPTTQQSLINASEIVWGAVDTVTVEFTVGYRSNHAAQARVEAARREAMLQRLLKGEPVAPGDVSATLGIDPGDELVVVVTDRAGEALVAELSRCMRYASMQSVWIDRGDSAVGVVVQRGVRSDAAVSALGTLQGFRIGAARPVRAITDLPASVSEAALALAALRPGVHGVASVFDDPLASLVAANHGLAADLLRHVLGPLLVRPERERAMLLETLVAFDDCDGSVPAAAERLYCHRNTVLNRLAKITKLTGLSFTAPSSLALAALAARCVRAGLLEQPSSG